VPCTVCSAVQCSTVPCLLDREETLAELSCGLEDGTESELTEELVTTRELVTAREARDGRPEEEERAAVSLPALRPLERRLAGRGEVLSSHGL
jgi:hypothetical protein